MQNCIWLFLFGNGVKLTSWDFVSLPCPAPFLQLAIFPIFTNFIINHFLPFLQEGEERKWQATFTALGEISPNPPFKATENLLAGGEHYFSFKNTQQNNDAKNDRKRT
jgi:hypothetical protein